MITVVVVVVVVITVVVVELMVLVLVGGCNFPCNSRGGGEGRSGG